MTGREKQVANAIARLAGTCRTLTRRQDLERIADYIVKETHDYPLSAVVEGIDSLAGAARFPTMDVVKWAINEVILKRRKAKRGKQ